MHAVSVRKIWILLKIIKVNITSKRGYCDSKIYLHLIKKVDCHGIRCNLGMFTDIFWTQNERTTDRFLLSVSIHNLLGLEEILINSAYIEKLPVPFVYSNVQYQIPHCRPSIRSGMKWICTRNHLSSLMECSISVSLLVDVVSSWVHIHSFTFPTTELFMMTGGKYFSV